MKTLIGALVAGFMAAGAANAANITLTTIDDGRTGQNAIGQLATVTNDTAIGVSQSGSLLYNGIFEFDLSSIASGSTINSVAFGWTNTRFISNTGSNPAKVDLFAFAGDGSVTDSDHTGGTQVVDSSTPAGGTGGDTDSFLFSDLSMLSSALTNGYLTVRFETNSFASINVAALENAIYDAATLTVDYTAPPTTSPIPLPAGMPLLLAGLGAFGIAKRRKR